MVYQQHKGLELHNINWLFSKANAEEDCHDRMETF